MPVFHGIEVNVVDMALQIGIVPNSVFPITTLPNSPLASGNLARAALHVAGKSARKSALDQAPAQRKIGIARARSAKVEPGFASERAPLLKVRALSGRLTGVHSA
jgi:hypothetical protein